jgi:hypothetical protein
MNEEIDEELLKVIAIEEQIDSLRSYIENLNARIDIEPYVAIYRNLLKRLEEEKNSLACYPKDACEIHGRCWTHSEWEKKE